jgi:hypothetical protein
MKTFVLAAAFAATALPVLAAPQNQGPDIGVSVQISQPGVYGRIDIGRFPQPQVVVAQPVIIQRPVYVQQAQVQQPQMYRAPEPIYMWVPPGHRKNWRKHCREYNACGVPVYFVRHDWYDKEVHRRGRDRDDDDGDDRRGRGRGHDKRD